MKGDVATVADYIANAPKWARGTLRELRRVIRKAAPEARESISYRMPYYSQNGRLGYIAAFKSHCSFFWLSAQDKKTFAKELASQTVVGSTLRIPQGGKVPAALIQKIIRSRVRENQMKKLRGAKRTVSSPKAVRKPRPERAGTRDRSRRSLNRST